MGAGHATDRESRGSATRSGTAASDNSGRRNSGSSIGRDGTNLGRGFRTVAVSEYFWLHAGKLGTLHGERFRHEHHVRGAWKRHAAGSACESRGADQRTARYEERTRQRYSVLRTAGAGYRPELRQSECVSGSRHNSGCGTIGRCVERNSGRDAGRTDASRYAAGWSFVEPESVTDDVAIDLAIEWSGYHRRFTYRNIAGRIRAKWGITERRLAESVGT
jgi:hypothetical protein